MEQARSTYCVNCGARLEPDARFCHVCGTAVAMVPRRYAPAAGPPSTSSAPSSVETWPDFESGGLPRAIGGYATFGERFVAVLIDLIILTVLTWTVALVLGGAFYALVGSSESTDTAAGGIVFAFLVLAHWLYFAVLESSDRQATVGKRAMKIVVTDEHGRRLSFARATGRSFARMLSGLFFFVGYLLAGFTARKQALHDLLAGTIVLKR